MDIIHDTIVSHGCIHSGMDYIHSLDGFCHRRDENWMLGMSFFIISDIVPVRVDDVIGWFVVETLVQVVQGFVYH